MLNCSKEPCSTVELLSLLLFYFCEKPRVGASLPIPHVTGFQRGQHTSFPLIKKEGKGACQSSGKRVSVKALWTYWRRTWVWVALSKRCLYHFKQNSVVSQPLYHHVLKLSRSPSHSDGCPWMLPTPTLGIPLAGNPSLATDPLPLPKFLMHAFLPHSTSSLCAALSRFYVVPTSSSHHFSKFTLHSLDTLSLPILLFPKNL